MGLRENLGISRKREHSNFESASFLKGCSGGSRCFARSDNIVHLKVPSPVDRYGQRNRVIKQVLATRLFSYEGGHGMRERRGPEVFQALDGLGRTPVVGKDTTAEIEGAFGLKDLRITVHFRQAGLAEKSIPDVAKAAAGWIYSLKDEARKLGPGTACCAHRALPDSEFRSEGPQRYGSASVRPRSRKRCLASYAHKTLPDPVGFEL